MKTMHIRKVIALNSASEGALIWKPADTAYENFATQYHPFTIGTLDEPNSVFPTVADAVAYYETTAAAAVISGLNTLFAPDEFEAGEIVVFDGQAAYNMLFEQAAVIATLTGRIEALENAV